MMSAMFLYIKFAWMYGATARRQKVYRTKSFVDEMRHSRYSTKNGISKIGQICKELICLMKMPPDMDILCDLLVF